MAKWWTAKKKMSFEFFFSFFWEESQSVRNYMNEYLLNQIQILYIEPISNKIEPKIKKKKKNLNIALSRF